MTEKKGSSGSFVFGFLLGAAAGMAASLLTAPRSGEETLAELRHKVEQWRSGFASGEGGVGQTAQQFSSALRERATGPLKSQVESVGREVLQQAQSQLERAIRRLEEAEQGISHPVNGADGQGPDPSLN